MSPSTATPPAATSLKPALPRLAEGGPSVRLALNLPPELDRRLTEYEHYYAEAYGSQPKRAAMAVAILEQFLDSDAGFAKWCK